MKNKVIIIIGCIAVVLITGIVLIGVRVFSNSKKIKNLLYEKYGEDFILVHNNGNEYESGLLPTFKKTGYKNYIVSPRSNREIKFSVRVKTNPLEIDRDDYVPASIAYNTSKKIEKNYKIGTKMYVHTSAADYKCDGKLTDSFFDNINGKGNVSISIYVEGLDSKFNSKEYLNKLVRDLNFDSNTTGTIRVYSVKKDGVEKIQKYYIDSKDLIKVENSNNKVKKKYFESTNKDFYINF